MLDNIKEHWEEVLSKSKNKILYLLDLSAKLHTLSQLTQENLCQAQKMTSLTVRQGYSNREKSTMRSGKQIEVKNIKCTLTDMCGV